MSVFSVSLVDLCLANINTEYSVKVIHQIWDYLPLATSDINGQRQFSLQATKTITHRPSISHIFRVRQEQFSSLMCDRAIETFALISEKPLSLLHQPYRDKLP